jgi:isopentenyl diphosphate isomerase/L-lactate dehydrogenase-like FMN-dependent dehydrogenase
LEKICRAVEGNAYYFNPRLRSPGGAPPFSMFQIYLTDDDDINRSVIERVKRTNLSVLIFTIDAGAGHGGIQMMDDYADFTYASKIAGNLFEDPMFNYKCFLRNRCVGTRTPSVLTYASRRLQIPVAKLSRTFDLKNAFTYARDIQFKGMAKQNSDKNPKSETYPWSVAYLARLAHSRQTISPAYPKITHRRGLPLVVKGVMSVEDAAAAQKSGADGVYVSNHGGRFVFNSASPIDVLREIHQKVKKSDPRFGVWFDSGVRSATDVLIAYSQGAEFVGIGRPVIYACVDNGRGGVRQVLQSILYTLRDQARLCGLTSLTQLHDKKRPLTVRSETSPR